MSDMQPTHEDEDLKAEFAALRRENERRAFDYQTIRTRRRASRRRGRIADGPNVEREWRRGRTLALTTISAVVAAAVLLWISDGVEPVPHPGPWAAGQWAMPTDVLLDLSTLPGDDLLHAFPEIGTLPTQAPSGAQNPSSQQRIPT